MAPATATETATVSLVNISTEKWPPRHRTYFGSLEVRSPESGETYAITPIRGCTGRQAELHVRDPPARHSGGSAVALRAHHLPHSQGQPLRAPLRPRLAPQRRDGQPRRARRHRVGRRAERHLHARRDAQAVDVSRPRGRARNCPHARDVLDQDHCGKAREVDDAPPSLLDSRPDRHCPVGRRAVPPVGQTTRARLVRGGLAAFPASVRGLTPGNGRSGLVADPEHDFAELVAALHALVGGSRFGQREDLVDDRSRAA